MDTLVNVRTFLAAARLGSFAAAARSLSVAPSVVSKRIGQLEEEFEAQLFHRTTRNLQLTVDGGRLLPKCQKLLSEFDDLRDVERKDVVQGHLRIDAPGTVTSRILGPIFCDFLVRYPRIDMDLRLIDRLDNPIERGCDLSIGTRPSTFEQIHDVPLMPYPCATYASKAYVEKFGAPQTPPDLAKHSCLVSLLYGTVWHFYGSLGDLAVNVRPRLSVNDTIVLREAVRRDLGIAVLPSSLAESDVRAGKLLRLLPDWRPPPLWLKAWVPTQRSVKPSVQALLDFLRSRLPAVGQPGGTYFAGELTPRDGEAPA
ncbi:MAG: LysR substrate-binding domain-containing protein [Croceibacterium sp.]